MYVNLPVNKDKNGLLQSFNIQEIPLSIGNVIFPLVLSFIHMEEIALFPSPNIAHEMEVSTSLSNTPEEKEMLEGKKGLSTYQDISSISRSQHSGGHSMNGYISCNEVCLLSFKY